MREKKFAGLERDRSRKFVSGINRGQIHRGLNVSGLSWDGCEKNTVVAGSSNREQKFPPGSGTGLKQKENRRDGAPMDPAARQKLGMAAGSGRERKSPGFLNGAGPLESLAANSDRRD